MERDELLRMPSYWTANVQIELYRQINEYMKLNNMNRKQLAAYLGCSQGYVTQLLNGDFDHKLSKFFELSLAINKIPHVTFEDVDDFIATDSKQFSETIEVDDKEPENVYDGMTNNAYLLVA